MKYKTGVFAVGAALLLTACGGEENATEQPAETGVLDEVVEVVEETVNVTPRETLDVVETEKLFNDSMRSVFVYEGLFTLDEEYTMAGVHTETTTELAFQYDYGQPFSYSVKGAEEKIVDGQSTTTNIHRFKKKDDNQYVLNAAGQYEIREYNDNDYAYKVMTSTPWQNVGGFFGFEDAYNAATVAEQDEDYIYLTTDLTGEGLASLAQTYLFKIHALDEATALRNFPEYQITDGTYMLKMDRETKTLLSIEWDFEAEGKNYIDETLELDHYSLYEVTNTTEGSFQIEDTQALVDGAVKPAE